MAKILVVDDEVSLREFLALFLRKEGYAVETAESGEKALSLLQKDTYDLIITDLKMGEVDGLKILEAAKKVASTTEVIVITAYGTMDTAIRAMKLGAYDYIAKPFKMSNFKSLIEKAIEKSQLIQENIKLKHELKGKYQFQNIVGQSEAMKEVYDLVLRVAYTKTNVLISGESGTGKELIARAIHYNGSRHLAPFLVINCGAIPENLIESELFGHVKGAFTGAVSDHVGLFQAAQQGTVFLDEITELPMNMQVKLLRVIQEKMIKKVGDTFETAVDIRIIAATNKNIEEEVNKGNFREDLFYRLNVIQIRIPPLRDRKEDILLLMDHFIKKYNKELGKNLRGVSPEALQILLEYNYVGNVRELENIIERGVTLENTDVISVENLPPALYKSRVEIDKGLPEITVPLPTGGVDLDLMIQRIEKDLITQALQKSDGQKKMAAKLLRISSRSFRYRSEKYDLPIDQEDD